jgi:hypothetical protein
MNIFLSSNDIVTMFVIKQCMFLICFLLFCFLCSSFLFLVVVSFLFFLPRSISFVEKGTKAVSAILSYFRFLCATFSVHSV